MTLQKQMKFNELKNNFKKSASNVVGDADDGDLVLDKTVNADKKRCTLLKCSRAEKLLRKKC